MIHKKCQFRAYQIFRDVPSDVMSLAQISHPCNSKEYTPDFTGIPPHILIMSEIEGFKYEI